MWRAIALHSIVRAGLLPGATVRERFAFAVTVEVGGANQWVGVGAWPDGFGVRLR